MDASDEDDGGRGMCWMVLAGGELVSSEAVSLVRGELSDIELRSVLLGLRTRDRWVGGWGVR